MKRLLSLIISVFASVLMAFGQSFSEDGITYNCHTDGVYVAGSSREGSLVIPESVVHSYKTYRVIGIEKFALGGDRLTSITVPKSITSIGEYAFYSSKSLKSVSFFCKRLGSNMFGNRYQFNTSIKEIILGNEVQEISGCAFEGCRGLTSITIPNSVTSIGGSAFEGCTGLTSITIPNSVTKIENNAFSHCSGLKTAIIGNSVPYIGDGTFFRCSELTSVTIGNSVTSIGNEAFRYCSKLTSVTIGNSVTYIDDFSFKDCNAITSVTFLCKSVGAWFKNFSTIKKIILGDKVSSIENSAFGSGKLTYIKSLAELPPTTNSSIYADTLELSSGCISNYINNGLWNSANYIYAKKDGTIYVCASIIEEGESLVEFANYEGKHIEVPLGTTIKVKEKKSPQNYDVIFYNWNNITESFKKNKSYTFKTSLSLNYNENIIRTYALTSQSAKNINVSTAGTLIDLLGIDNVKTVSSLKLSGNLNGTDILAIRKMENLKILDMEDANIINGGTSYYENYTTSKDAIGDYFFKDKSNLKMILLPQSINKISNNAFRDCSGLEFITIPKNVTSIGSYVFSGCKSLTSIAIFCKSIGAWFKDLTTVKNVALGNEVTSIGNSAFNGCTGLTSIAIPNSVTSIGEYAFNNCSGLTSVTIPNSITSIGNDAFYGCNGLKSVTILCSTIGSWFKNNTSIKNIILGNSVTSIGSSAFEGCSGLTSITIPNSITSIESKTFYGCKGLTSITIPNSVTSIGSYAFSGCGFSSITIPNSVTSIGSYAFSGCGFSSITIPNSVTSIGSYAFSGCGFSSITIPNSVTSIEEGTFWGCSGLLSIIIPNSVMTIGKCAFYGCKGLTSITIPNSVKSIGGSTFCGCSELASVTIPNSVTSIGSSAFQGCSGLTSITIPNSVTSIGEYAFQYCSGLTNITIPNSIKSIEKSTFSDCNGLTSVTIPNSVTSIGNSAFANCKGLTSLTIGNNVKSIGSSAFYNCKGLTSLTIGNNVTSIENFAFKYCDALTTITFLCKSVGAWFKDFTSIKNIILGNSVTSIGSSAFYGCKGLISITIPNSVTSIGNTAFYGCNSLAYVTSLNTTPPKIESNTFPNYNATLYIPTGCKTIYWLHPYWENFTNVVEIDVSNIQYTLTYLVDGEVYKTYKLKVGEEITPEAEPTKEGYTFSGWSEIPSTMPNHDVTVSGTFTKNGGGADDDNPSSYKSLDDYIANSTTTLQNYRYTINPTINNIKKVYVDLTKGTTNSGYCYLWIENSENTKIIDFSSKYVSTSSDNFIVHENNKTKSSNIKNLVDNKTYSWLYYNPKNSNEVIIDVEAFFGCLGFITGWQQNFGTSFIVNIITESTETSIVPIESDSRDKDDKYYNLQGQRVLYPRNGIYIKNGKKVFIK